MSDREAITFFFFFFSVSCSSGGSEGLFFAFVPLRRIRSLLRIFLLSSLHLTSKRPLIHIRDTFQSLYPALPHSKFGKHIYRMNGEQDIPAYTSSSRTVPIFMQVQLIEKCICSSLQNTTYLRLITKPTTPIIWEGMYDYYVSTLPCVRTRTSFT